MAWTNSIPTCTIEYTIDPTHPNFKDDAEEAFVDNDMFTFNTNEKWEVVTCVTIPAWMTRNELAEALFDMHITYNILDKEQLEEQGFTLFGSEGNTRVCKIPTDAEKQEIWLNQAYITNWWKDYKDWNVRNTSREYFVEYDWASYYIDDEEFIKTLDFSHLVPKVDDLLS